MKRIYSLMIICVVLLAGCGNNKLSANLSDSDNSGTQAVNTLNNLLAENDNGALLSSDAATNSPPVSSSSAEDNIYENNADMAIEAPSGDLVEIKEKMFTAQINDIYYNAEDYMGKTIKYEGVFDIYENPDTGESYYTVIRYGPGCCGDDGNIGFEVKWDNEYPENNDWVEAVGVLEEYEEDGDKYLRIALTSLTVQQTRGTEFVTQ